MTRLRRFYTRLVNLLTGRHSHERLQEEIEAHLAALTQENIHAGMTPEEAARQARLKFGSIEAVRADYHDKATLPLLEDLLRDSRYAVRSLCKSPVFTLVAVFSLMLGIGANTAIFGLIDTILLRPLAYPDADRLVQVQGYDPKLGRDSEPQLVSCPRWELIRDQQQVFESLTAATGASLTFTGHGDAEQLLGNYVSAGFFQTLGVHPSLGRGFLSGEDQPGKPPVVVLSQAFWQRRFGGDPAAVGQSLTLNGVPHTVVGVLTTPLAAPYDRSPLFVARDLRIPEIPPTVLESGLPFLSLVGRLKPEVSLAQAEAALQDLAASYQQAFPGHGDAGSALKAVSLQENVVGRSRLTFYVLAGAVGGVLLLACVNVANLLLARLAGRQREIAVRAALGASRGRLARQFLTESLLLSLLAGTLGTLLAWWVVGLVQRAGADVIPRADEVRLSATTLLFTLGVSLVVGIVLGLVPALRAAQGNPGEALQRTSARGSAGEKHLSRLRAALLVAQIALSLALLVGTGLLLTSLWQLGKAPLGFNPDGLLVTDVGLSIGRYPTQEKQMEFFRQLTERLRASPGVQGCAVADWGPLLGIDQMPYVVDGQPVPPVQQRRVADYCNASPDYFATLQIPLLRGRVFTDADRAGAPPVVIINETMATELFPQGDAVGQRLLCGPADATIREIVGVVADVRTNSLVQPPAPEMYFSMFQQTQPYMRVYLRGTTSAPALSLVPELKKAARSVDPDQPVAESEDMRVVVNRTVNDRRWLTLLLTSFAVLALVLAAVGIYGIAAYSVTQRTREIGVRMALGAGRGDVFRLIVGGGMKPIALGVVLGGLMAFGLTRLLGSLLYGVGAGDPLTFADAAAVLGLVALLANYLPALRAMHIDPLTALREE